MSADKVGFIGAGNMAEALAGGLLSTGRAGKENLLASDASPDRRQFFTDKFGVGATEDNAEVFKASDVVVLAVKPQILPGVLEALAQSPAFPGDARKVIVSIAAGIPMALMEEILYAGLTEEEKDRLPIIRVMPNTPFLVGLGMAGMASNSRAAEGDLAAVEAILSASGRVIRFEEEALDAVTAVSGSGPAYVFYLAEAMIKAGESLGLSPEDARKLVIATVAGAAGLMDQSTDDPAELRRKVTSPGGTTEAALKVMKGAGMGDKVVKALTAARDRSKELSKR